MQAVIAEKPWLKDPLSVRKKWDEDEYKLIDHGGGKQLCFGILWNNGEIVPHPPVNRALEITKQALITAGHKGQPTAKLLSAFSSLNSTACSDRLEATEALGNVLHDSELLYITMIAHIDSIFTAQMEIFRAGMTEDIRACVSTSGEPIVQTMYPGNPAGAFLRPSPDGITAYQLWQLHKKKRDLRKEYLDHWESTAQATGTGRPVDAIISPVAPYAAPPHGMTTFVLSYLSDA
jgi:amidase